MFFKDYTGRKIYAHDGSDERLDNGAHLIGDGPDFIAKMREKGIVEPISEYDEGHPPDESGD